MFSSKISLLLNSDLDQSVRNNFLADLTDSISNSDLLTSVLNALDQLKKGKSDGSKSIFWCFYICQRYQQPFESTFHCRCKTWLCSQALERLYSSANSQARKRLDLLWQLQANCSWSNIEHGLRMVHFTHLWKLSPPCFFNLALNLACQLTCALA